MSLILLLLYVCGFMACWFILMTAEEASTKGSASKKITKAWLFLLCLLWPLVVLYVLVGVIDDSIEEAKKPHE